MQTNNTYQVYSLLSGTFFEVLEKDAKLLDNGHLPLKKNLSARCNKCFGRGHIGRDTTTLAFQPCRCIRKEIDFDLIRSLLPQNQQATP